MDGKRDIKSQNRNSSEVIICQNVKMVMFLSTTGKHRKRTETFFGIKERKINDNIMCLLANIHALYTTPLFFVLSCLQFAANMYNLYKYNTHLQVQYTHKQVTSTQDRHYSKTLASITHK